MTTNVSITLSESQLMALAYGFGRAAQAASDNDQLMEALHAVR